MKLRAYQNVGKIDVKYTYIYMSFSESFDTVTYSSNRSKVLVVYLLLTIGYTRLREDRIIRRATLRLWICRWPAFILVRRSREESSPHCYSA